MKAAQAFFTRGHGGVRGDMTQDFWYWTGFKKTDLEIIRYGQDNPDDVDFVLAGRGSFMDDNTATEMLNYLDKRPNCKLIIIEGGRFPLYNFPDKGPRLEILSRVSLFLHNSEFEKDDWKVISSKLKKSQIKMVNLNVFTPEIKTPLPLEERLENVFMFGAVDEYKGTLDFWHNFESYKNSKYAYGSAGMVSPVFVREGLRYNKPEMDQKLNKEIFNFIGAYEKGCQWIQWFLPHTRFALFGWKERPSMIEAPEYSFLECIEQGVPVVVRKEWLESIKVFGKKPDIENSGIITFEDWSELKDLDKYEADYISIVEKQQAFLCKWWGESVAENLVKLFKLA